MLRHIFQRIELSVAMTSQPDRSLQKAYTFYLNKKIARLKSTLLIVMFVLTLILLGEFYFSAVNIVDMAIFTCLLFIGLLYFWIHSDTVDIIISLCLWAFTLLASFVAWNNSGLFDTAILAFPCISMLAIVMGKKALYIPIFIYLQVVTFLLLYAHIYGYAGPINGSVEHLYVRTFDIFILINFFSFSTYFYVNDMKISRRQLNKRITRLKRQLHSTNQLINYDQNTHLPNERICQHEILPLLKDIADTSRILSFIRMEIHNLRNINNSIGHEVGDLLLNEVSLRLQSLVKEDEFLYLFQGNEFVFIKISSNYQQVNNFREQIMQAMSSSFSVRGYELDAFVSVGISVAPFDGVTVEALQKKSHLALSHASNKGINHSLFYDENMTSSEDLKYQLIKDLKFAIKQNEFQLYFQPKVDMQTNKIVGAEALIRWNSSVHGFVGPDVFIPIAEESGLIVDISKWVLHEACNTCKRWQEMGFEHFHIAVNISSVDFRRGNLPRVVTNALNLSGLQAKYLELEITESLMIDDVCHIQSQIQQLHQMGVSFAIDDFGTGYSNLAYLSKFNVSTLKIDQSFVKNIMDSKEDFLIVKAIINMSKSLGMENVAEGIEEQPIIEKLTAEGCYYGQGYFWSKPVVNEEFIALVRQHNESVT